MQQCSQHLSGDEAGFVARASEVLGSSVERGSHSKAEVGSLVSEVCGKGFALGKVPGSIRSSARPDAVDAGALGGVLWATAVAMALP